MTVRKPRLAHTSYALRRHEPAVGSEILQKSWHLIRRTDPTSTMAISCGGNVIAESHSHHDSSHTQPSHLDTIPRPNTNSQAGAGNSSSHRGSDGLPLCSSSIQLYTTHFPSPFLSSHSSQALQATVMASRYMAPNRNVLWSYQTQ